MPTALETIRAAIAAHSLIRSHMSHVGQSVNDIQAVLGLQQSYAAWAQSSIDELAKRQQQLEQQVGVLREGLRTHFMYEETNLPPLLGKILTQALLLEHGEVNEEMKRVQLVLLQSQVAGVAREEILTSQKKVMAEITSLNDMIEKHAAREEVVLRMMERALTQEPKTSPPV